MSVADLKAQANRLGAHLTNVHGVHIKHTSLLEAIAATHGARDWNTLLASYRAAPLNATPPAACPLKGAERPTQPLLIDGDLQDCFSMQALLVSQQISAGGSVLLLDDSGTTTAGEHMLRTATRGGRAQDFVELNFSQPERSHRYSPIADGSAQQVAAKLLRLLPLHSASPGAAYYVEQAGELLMQVLAVLGASPSLGHLVEVLTDLSKLERVCERPDAQSLRQLINAFRSPKTGAIDVARYKGTYGGILARLALLLGSGGKNLLDTTNPDIRVSLLRQRNQLVYMPLAASREAEFIVQCMAQDISDAALAATAPADASPLLVILPQSTASAFAQSCPNGWRWARFVVVKQR
ncbi:hypothetical protein D3C71_20710 [compost metagenome]